MFGYIDEFSDGILTDTNQFKIVWNGNNIWIVNYIKINEYNNEKIVLKVKGNSVIVEGVDLRIKMLEKKEIVIGGRFSGVSLEKPYKREG